MAVAGLLNPLDELARAPHQFGVFSDFHEFVTGDLLTSLVADASTSAAVTDAAGGVIALGTAATDNNEAAVKTTKEVFLFAANKPIVAECRLKYAEANTDDANVFFGLADALGANMLVDDGAGPKTSFSGCGFYKVDGGTRWQVVSSVGTTQTKTDTAHTAGGSSYQTLRVEVHPNADGTTADVIFSIDTAGGQNLSQCRYQDDSNVRLNTIRHTITLSGATEMQLGAYVKAGGANAETLNVDYIAGYQAR